MKNWLFAIASICLLWASCKKDDPENLPTGSTNWPGATVRASFVGQVLDENGVAVEGAAVRVGAKTETTDVNGIFIIRNQNVNSARAIVTAYKAGYFDAFRTLFVQKNSENKVVFRLLKKQNAGTFTASAGGKIAIAGGAEIDFAANSMTKNGQPFSGKVNVAAKWLDPTDAFLNEKTPGGLRGLRTDGEENGLQTFGMLGVELTDDSGQKIEIASGQKAKITMPIPSNLLADAPATIPLWHFSEIQGIWIEEGTATKIGSEYVGEVAHFSWWNCDAPFGTIKFKVCLTDLLGNALSDKIITISSTNYGTTSAWIDSSGCAEGLVPGNETLVLKVLSNSICGAVIFEQTIGPFAADTDLGTLAINPNGTNGQVITVVLTGKLVDCAGQPVANSYVRVENGPFAFTDAAGNFSYAPQYCSNDVPTSFTIIGYDLSNGKASQPQTKNYATNIDFGTISVCDDLDEYVRYSLDGGAILTLLPSPDSSFASNQVYLGGYDPTKNEYISMAWNHNNVAANNIPLIQFYISSGNTFIETNPNAPTFTVKTNMTSFPQVVGQYLIGTFSGAFVPLGTTTTRTISGSYRVKRNW